MILKKKRKDNLKLGQQKLANNDGVRSRVFTY